MPEDTISSELVLPSGRVVVMESPLDGDGPQDASLSEKVPFDELLKDLRELCSMLLDTTRAIAPTEAELELSVGVEAGTGRLMAFMVDGKASGGIKIRLSWKASGG